MHAGVKNMKGQETVSTKSNQHQR